MNEVFYLSREPIYRVLLSLSPFVPFVRFIYLAKNQDMSVSSPSNTSRAPDRNKKLETRN